MTDDTYTVVVKDRNGKLSAERPILMKKAVVPAQANKAATQAVVPAPTQKALIPAPTKVPLPETQKALSEHLARQKQKVAAQKAVSEHVKSLEVLNKTRKKGGQDRSEKDLMPLWIKKRNTRKSRREKKRRKTSREKKQKKNKQK
jgi:hypothetical protein